MDKLDRKTHYGARGLYNGYDRNHKERDKLDYYATPPSEVTNILDIMNLDFTNSIILEPCAGEGHMLAGIIKHIQDTCTEGVKIVATDIKDRGNKYIKGGEEYDFLSDDYSVEDPIIDYIIMNPPYSLIEPFVMKSLSIADRGVLMLGRLQFLEGQKRFEKIFQYCPPSDVFVYVDRIACYKNGDFSLKSDAIQAYAWYYWDIQNPVDIPRLHWIRRADKKGE